MAQLKIKTKASNDMGSPSAKKQKMSEFPKPAIIFESPGLKADLCLKVVEQEFHVNSMVMKVNCGFFRTFLEPRGGLLPFSTSNDFSSQWFTSLDGYDENTFGYQSWALSLDHQFANTDLSLFRGDPGHEIHIFEKFLCAVFGRQYELEDSAELSTMADLARYYVAIPTVSTSLYAALMRSSKFTSHILNNPWSVLESAKILRHEIFFRDSFILALGPWSEPKYEKAKDPELVKLAEDARRKICSKIVKAQTILLSKPPKGVQDVTSGCMAKKGSDKVVLLPMYYRKCQDLLDQQKSGTSTLKDLDHLLQNELRLIHGATAGKGDFKDYFLCLGPHEYELPWDPTQEQL